MSEQALAMSVKGHPTTKIAEELECRWETADKLITFALEKRDINEDEEREKSLAHHRAIITWCWEQLESPELAKNAQNRPAYVARAQASQSEIDRLNNVTPPLKTQQEVNVNYTDRSLEEYFAELDRIAEGDSEANLRESVDTR
jgi:hypothetical protein